MLEVKVETCEKYFIFVSDKFCYITVTKTKLDGWHGYTVKKVGSFDRRVGGVWFFVMVEMQSHSHLSKIVQFLQSFSFVNSNISFFVLSVSYLRMTRLSAF
jgi:hypothetical protein